jgi:formate-dependent nitrite reductase membrane component NrfD
MMIDGRRQRDDRRAPAPPPPVIHAAHWKWLIIVYFFLGGIAGAVAAIGGLAGRSEKPRARTVVRASRYISLAAFLPCPILLILDLGRPARFLHMLRVVKLRSPMSFGTWVLLAFGGVVTAAAAKQAAEDGLVRGGAARAISSSIPGSATDRLAIVTGVGVAGYTGVLLAATAVPLWAKRPALLASLFVTSAFASGSAALALVRGIVHHGEFEPDVERVKQIASLAESAVLLAWIAKLGGTATPLTLGQRGRLVRHGVAGMGLALPMALNAWSMDRHTMAGRVAHLLSALLTLIGGFALRYAVVTGGRDSADDPQASFDFTASPQKPGR